METESAFQNLLQQYVFTVADTFIELASPDEQQQLLKLVSDMGKSTYQPPQPGLPKPYQGQRA